MEDLSEQKVNQIKNKWNKTIKKINDTLEDNDINIRMPKIIAINPSTIRYRHLQERLQEDCFNFDKICSALLEQQFCWGLNEYRWQANFDWITKNKENYIKVLERKYRR